jgi:hypothetical protein
MWTTEGIEVDYTGQGLADGLGPSRLTPAREWPMAAPLPTYLFGRRPPIAAGGELGLGASKIDPHADLVKPQATGLTDVAESLRS